MPRRGSGCFRGLLWGGAGGALGGARLRHFCLPDALPWIASAALARGRGSSVPRAIGSQPGPSACACPPGGWGSLGGLSRKPRRALTGSLQTRQMCNLHLGPRHAGVVGSCRAGGPGVGLGSRQPGASSSRSTKPVAGLASMAPQPGSAQPPSSTAPRPAPPPGRLQEDGPHLGARGAAGRAPSGKPHRAAWGAPRPRLCLLVAPLAGTDPHQGRPQPLQIPPRGRGLATPASAPRKRGPPSLLLGGGELGPTLPLPPRTRSCHRSALTFYYSSSSQGFGAIAPAGARFPRRPAPGLAQERLLSLARSLSPSLGPVRARGWASLPAPRPRRPGAVLRAAAARVSAAWARGRPRRSSW